VSFLRPPTVSAGAAWGCAALFVIAAALGPLVGDAASFRHAQTVLALMLAVWWWRRPEALAGPMTRASWVAFALAAWVWAVCCAGTHFLSFQINGVDFSIFEWMVGSTARGQLGYSRIYELNHFGVHSTFVLLLLVPVYALFSSPWVMLIAGATLIWAGIFPVRRLVRWAHGGPHGVLELVAMAAWLGNPWLGGLINAGFRIESLLPVLTLWFLLGWVEGRRWLWVGSMIALWLSKEDSCLFLSSFACVAALVERHRARSAAFIVIGSLGWLALYSQLVQPALLGHPPAYLAFWSGFGNTMPSVVVGMLADPLMLAERLATSHWWVLALPALLVPLASPRALGGMAPTVLLLGAATYEPMHRYEMYYPVGLIAFVIFGALEVWRRHPGRARTWVFFSLLNFPLFWGAYARSVPVDWGRLEAFAEVRRALANEAHLCVQNILFPHLGLDDRLINLGEPGLCLDHAEITVLVNEQLSTEPHARADFQSWLRDWERQREVTQYPHGFTVLRAKQAPQTQQPPVP